METPTLTLPITMTVLPPKPLLQHNWIILIVVRPMQPAQAWLLEIPFMQGSVCMPLRP